DIAAGAAADDKHVRVQGFGHGSVPVNSHPNVTSHQVIPATAGIHSSDRTCGRSVGPGLRRDDREGAYQPMNSIAGCSSSCFKRWIKAAASQPSTMRWSNEDDRFIILATATCPPRTIGRSAMRLTPIIATSG